MRLSSLLRRSLLLAAVAVAALASSATAQATGGISGTVTRGDDGSPLAGVIVRVVGTQITTTTNPSGKYTLQRIPTGPQTVRFTWLGYGPREFPVAITAGGMAALDAKLEPLPVQLTEIMVSGASRAPERVTEAPSAITQVDPRTLVTSSITGQAPLALRNIPGVDLAQSGVTDFNVNARGFNSSLNRRVLTLQDGRDLAIAFLGAQEWNTLTLPTEDFTKMEFVSGPGSALYGANAYSGVLDITTPTAREAQGTKITVGGGALGGPSGGWDGGSPASFRADLRHAGVFGQGRFGYRLNLGYSQTDTWSRSRTLRDSTSLQQEYADATDSLVPKQRAEARPLKGQTVEPEDQLTGEVSGNRDPITSMYGSARFDYYAANGAVGTFEGGVASVANEVFVTGIGRVQVTGATRPWARLNWADNRFNVMAYWNGRRTGDPQYSLASGAPLLETSDIIHVEGQGNESFGDGRGQIVYGASARNIRLDTDTTLMIGRDDDRSDYYYAGFAQLSWDLSDITKLVLAGRIDLGTLIDPQFSPKVALVVTPSDKHSFRFTVNRAFQTPNYSEYFLRATAGAAPLGLLETGLRASVASAPDTLTLKKALAKVTPGQLFDGPVRPVVARGNSKLQVETNTGFEVGYRGDLSDRFYISVDAYFNSLGNFVTDLLYGNNPAFTRWTAPTNTTTALTATEKAVLEATVYGAINANPALRPLGPGLTRQEDRLTAVVLSYSNAGSATQWGTDIGAGFHFTDELTASAGFSWFDYKVDTDEIAAGDKLLANTPEFRYIGALNYAGRQGLDLGASFRASTGFPWSAGVFTGWIEPGFTLDATAGYRINNNLKVFLTGNNILNEQWFSVYGGSVNGRRIMAGATATF